MASTKSSMDYSQNESMALEQQGLMHSLPIRRRRSSFVYSLSHIIALYAANILSLLIVGTLLVRSKFGANRDLSVVVYCELELTITYPAVLVAKRQTAPANEAVEHIQAHKFRAALVNHTPYIGFPTDETDRLWSELYNCPSLPWRSTTHR